MLTGFLALMHSCVGNFDEAIREAHKSFELYKDFPVGYFALAETYLATEKKEEAIEATEKLAAVAPEWGWFLAYVYAITGYQEKAELILKELEQAEKNGWIAMGLAVLYGAMGKYDDAFRWIKFEPHHVWIPWIAVMPMWKPLHKDPRHGEFVRRLKLPGL
jgi:tetratricopeptide (TPR) repeat protein